MSCVRSRLLKMKLSHSENTLQKLLIRENLCFKLLQRLMKKIILLLTGLRHRKLQEGFRNIVDLLTSTNSQLEIVLRSGGDL